MILVSTVAHEIINLCERRLVRVVRYKAGHHSSPSGLVNRVGSAMSALRLPVVPTANPKQLTVAGESVDSRADGRSWQADVLRHQLNVLRRKTPKRVVLSNLIAWHLSVFIGWRLRCCTPRGVADANRPVPWKPFARSGGGHEEKNQTRALPHRRPADRCEILGRRLGSVGLARGKASECSAPKSDRLGEAVDA
jgi:hypothetical protein